MDFKVGDFVYVSEKYGDYEFNEPPKLRICKIVNTNSLHNGNTIGVEFFDDIQGHSCRGNGAEGYCWNIHQKHLHKIKTNIRY